MRLKDRRRWLHQGVKASGWVDLFPPVEAVFPLDTSPDEEISLAAFAERVYTAIDHARSNPEKFITRPANESEAVAMFDTDPGLFWHVTYLVPCAPLAFTTPEAFKAYAVNAALTWGLEKSLTTAKQLLEKVGL